MLMQQVIKILMLSLCKVIIFDNYSMVAGYSALSG